VIKLTQHGLVDRIQADRSWAAVRRSPYLGRADPNAQSAKARIRRTKAKLELARDAVARIIDQYAPRSAAIEEYRRQGAFLIDALKAMPAQEADTLARELSITPAKARVLLDDFVALCIKDIGDLSGQLIEVVHRVH
jgi:hypothetical protein